MTGLTVYSDTTESYEAGLVTARGAAFGMSDAERERLVASARAYEAAQSTNKYARAYAAGVLDGVAPFGLYA